MKTKSHTSARRRSCFFRSFAVTLVLLGCSITLLFYSFYGSAVMYHTKTGEIYPLWEQSKEKAEDFCRFLFGV